MQGRDRMSLYPLGEGIDGDEKEAVPIGILRKRSSGVDTPAEERCRSLVNPAQLLQRWWRYSVLLPRHAATYTVAYILVHAWPPKLLADLAKQLITPAIGQVLMDIHQQLCTAHQRRDIHPMLPPVSGRRQKYL